MLEILLALSHTQQVIPIMAPVILMIFFIVAGLRGKLSKVKLSNRRLLSNLFFIFYVLILTYINNVTDFKLIPFLSGDGRIVYFLLFTILLMFIINSEFELEKVIKSYIVVCTLVSLFSIIIFYSGLSLTYGDSWIGAMRKNRVVLVGLLGTKNPFAGVTGGAILITLFLYFEKKIFTRKQAIVIIGILTLSFVVAASRGFLLGILASLFVFYTFYYKQNKRLILGGGVFFIMMLMVSFYVQSSDSVNAILEGSDSNVLTRFKIYEKSFTIIDKSLLFGISPGNFRLNQLEIYSTVGGIVGFVESGIEIQEGLIWEDGVPIGQHTHNVLLQFLVDFGLLGTIWFFLFPMKVMTMKKRYSDINIYIKLYKIIFVYLFVAGFSAAYTLITPSIAYPLIVLTSYLSKVTYKTKRLVTT